MRASAVRGRASVIRERAVAAQVYLAPVDTAGGGGGLLRGFPVGRVSLVAVGPGSSIAQALQLIEFTRRPFSCPPPRLHLLRPWGGTQCGARPPARPPGCSGRPLHPLSREASPYPAVKAPSLYPSADMYRVSPL